MLLYTVARNLKKLETAGLRDAFGAREHCGFKHQSLIILWKFRLGTNDVQGLILLILDDWIWLHVYSADVQEFSFMAIFHLSLTLQITSDIVYER